MLTEFIDPCHIPKQWGGAAPEPSTEAGLASMKKRYESKRTDETWSEFESRQAEEGWDWDKEVFEGHVPVLLGGDVPEELYLSNAFDVDSATEASVLAGALKEVSMVIDAANTPLAWSFKTDHNISFSLRYKVGMASANSQQVLPPTKVDSHLFPVPVNHHFDLFI